MLEQEYIENYGLKRQLGITLDTPSKDQNSDCSGCSDQWSKPYVAGDT